LIDKNEVYANHEHLKDIDDEYLYAFRCSVVHAFSLPEQKDEIALVVINGQESAFFRRKELKEGLSKRGLVPVIVSVDSLTALITKGAIDLQHEIFVPFETLNENQVDGILRVHKELYRRGSATIPLL